MFNLPTSLTQAAQLLGRDAVELESELAEARRKLLARRQARVAPGLDDKVLVSWNGLAIDALARAGAALDEPRYTQAAAEAAAFLCERMRRPDGRLLHTWRRGAAKLDAYLDDYACLANALVSVYESTFAERWIEEAIQLAETMRRHFWDDAGGGFYFTADDHEALIARNKDFFDHSVPSGNSMAAYALARLGKLTGRGDLWELAERTLAASAGVIEQAATAAGQALVALDYFLGPTPEIVIVGDPAAGETAAAIADLRRRYIPNKAVACREAPERGGSALAAAFRGKVAGEPPPAVYVCENFACQAPAHGPSAAKRAWDSLAAT
jgi:uncharacterized protein YyaL (SSP411 family)